MSGKSLAGDFDGQVREVFSRLGQTLEEADGTLADMVTMTVFITDSRHGDRFTQLRKEIFDNFPASALITVAGLARPEMLVEVSGDRGTWLSQSRETLIVHRAKFRCRLAAGESWIRTSSSGASGEADAFLPVRDRPR